MQGGITMNKGIVFLLGVVVGAVGGGFLAYRKVSMNAEDILNNEMERMKDYYEQRIQKFIKNVSEPTDKEEGEPAKELSKSSYEDYIKEHEDDEENKVQYNNITKEVKEDKKKEPQHDDYIYITKDQFDDVKNGHDKATLFLFDTEQEDRKIVVDEDEDRYEFNRMAAAFRRTNVKEDEDFEKFYCCDPEEMVDYEVVLRTEEYYKGIIDDILAEE